MISTVHDHHLGLDAARLVLHELNLLDIDLQVAHNDRRQKGHKEHDH